MDDYHEINKVYSIEAIGLLTEGLCRSNIDYFSISLMKLDDYQELNEKKLIMYIPLKQLCLINIHLVEN